MDTDGGVGYQVYTGFWNNWGQPPALRTQLTLSRTDANLVIAFVAFFVAAVGARLWRIVCFILHWTYSARDARDGLHHQRQAFLRNSANPEASLITLLELIWGWRRNASRPFLRLAVPLLAAVVCVFGFAAASGFSSKIAPGSVSEVLLSGENCRMSSTALLRNASSLDLMFRWNPFIVKFISRAASYAEQCYSQRGASSLLACATFPRKYLASSVVTNASCPFDPTLCKTQDGNLVIDSGLLDLHDHFGVNVPPEQRFQFRRVTHCAPLVTEGFKSDFKTAEGRPYTRYHYGSSLSSPNWTYMYPTDLADEFSLPYSSVSQADYDITPYYAMYSAGYMIDQISTFRPIDALNITDSNVYLIFLSAGRVRFLQNVTDPWYNAQRREGNAALFYGSNDTVQRQETPTFTQSEAGSPLGCVSREQYCGPGAASSNCTPLMPNNDAHYAFQDPLMETDPEQGERVRWVVGAMLTGTPDFPIIIKALGNAALSSQSNRLQQGLQPPIAENQWQLDVQSWFDVGLAMLQASLIYFANGPDPDIRDFTAPPATAGAKSICENQKILSTTYVSLSVFGLAFVVTLGGLIIFVSLALDPLAAFLQRRHNVRRYQQLEWCTNDTLQLQRLAHEALGVGTWDKATSRVPVTGYGEELAVLDCSDPEHPRLVKGEEEASGCRVVASNKPVALEAVVSLPESGTDMQTSCEEGAEDSVTVVTTGSGAGSIPTEDEGGTF